MPLWWMEKDDYGYCGRLGTEAVAVLSPSGLGALRRKRPRLRVAPGQDQLHGQRKAPARG